jgi:hypothetical protein
MDFDFPEELLPEFADEENHVGSTPAGRQERVALT